MKSYSLASEPREVAKGSDEQALKASLYDWALGRRSGGQPQESSHVHIEASQPQVDAYELARLIRGEDR